VFSIMVQRTGRAATRAQWQPGHTMCVTEPPARAAAVCVRRGGAVAEPHYRTSRSRGTTGGTEPVLAGLHRRRDHGRGSGACCFSPPPAYPQ
jgi:hypothetical protein